MNLSQLGNLIASDVVLALFTVRDCWPVVPLLLGCLLGIPVDLVTAILTGGVPYEWPVYPMVCLDNRTAAMGTWT